MGVLRVERDELQLFASVADVEVLTPQQALGAVALEQGVKRGRIETGHRWIALDQLSAIARALGATLDQLVETAEDDDVVIRPQRDEAAGMTAWMLTRDRGPHGVTVAKMRITRTAKHGAADLGVHPGRDWFTVLSGTAALQLADRTILVETGQSAEFSTMVPHAINAHRGPVEIIAILDHDGERAHLHPSRVDLGS